MLPAAAADMQLTAAGLLVAMVGLGSLVATLPSPVWPMIVLGAALAGLVSIVSDAEDWHPPGPLFALFAFGGSASVTRTGRWSRRSCPSRPRPWPPASFAAPTASSAPRSAWSSQPAASPVPPEVLLVDRLVESIVGALIGIGVGFATRGWGAARESPGA